MSHSIPNTVPLQVQLALAAAQRGVIDAQQSGTDAQQRGTDAQQRGTQTLAATQRGVTNAQQRGTEQRAISLYNVTSLAFSWRTLRCCVCNEDIYNERVMLISTNPQMSYRHIRCVPANFFGDTTCITRIPGFHNIPDDILYDADDDDELYNDLYYLITTTPRRLGRKPVYAG